MRRSTFALVLLLSSAGMTAERPYEPPRLDNGQPDMQGVWVASNSTPLQRPPGFATLVIDDAQAAKLLAALDARAEERCLASQTVQPPILSIRAGVNLHQIVQTADSFVFMSEFIGATRIIRLSSRRLPAAVTSWLGDSIGRRDEAVLEYACHEANYSLMHILEGARERDRQAAQ